MSTHDPDSSDIETYAECYFSFSKNLRTWLIAYGIGAPILFASQDSFSQLLKQRSEMCFVICMFLIGVAVQVLSAFLYKASMWYIMWGAMKPEFKSTRRYNTANWVSEQFWLDLLFDVASIGVFAWATIEVMMLYVAYTTT